MHHKEGMNLERERSRERTISSLILSFKEVSIDEDGCTHEESLLVGSGILGKRHFKHVGFGKDLGHETLWLFENLANVRSISISLFLIGWKDMEANLAATPSARITLGATVDATSTAACGLMNLVDMIALAITEGELWNTPIAIFCDGSHGLSAARDGRMLVAAALAGANGTCAGTMDSQHFRIRVEFLDLHGKGMTGRAPKAAAAVGIFEGVGNLCALCVKVLELGTSFAPENLLAPAPTRLAHFQLGRARQVRLEGVAATVHRFRHDKTKKRRREKVDAYTTQRGCEL